MSTTTQIQARPQYIQEIDEALLQRIFGTPDPETGILSGGIIDREDLFNIPNLTQAQSQLQEAVAGTFDTPEERQAFIDRYQPYFTDAQGIARYLPDASAAFTTAEGTLSDAISDYFPDAKSYLEAGRGGVDAKTAFDTELSGAKLRSDLATGAFGAQDRADTLFGDARGTVKGGLGLFAPQEIDAGGKFTPQSIDTGGTFSTQPVDAGGEFAARDAFDRGTGRSLELAEQGLGRFDPSARVEEFMDPYKQQVIDAALKKIDREGTKARGAAAAKAIGAGAFGGSRAGVQLAETERAIEEARQNTVANLLSQGYDKALSSAMATDEAARKRALQASGLTGELGARGATLESKAFEDAARRGLSGQTLDAQLAQRAFEDAAKRDLAGSTAEAQMAQKAFEDAAKRGLAATSTEAQMGQKAFEDAARRQLSGGAALADISKTQLGAETGSFEAAQNRMLKSADLYRSMGLSSAEAQAKAAEDEKKRSLEAGRLTGGLGSTLGQLGGAQAGIGRAFGALAGQSANIGQAYAGMQPADLGFLYELGGKDRAYDQQYQDMLRKNQLLTTQEALAPYSYAQNFLTGSPSASIYGAFTSAPSAAPNPFLSGVGAYATGQGLMQQQA